MTPVLGWLVAALFLALVQIFAAAGAKRRQDGLDWAAGNRDRQPVYTGVAARLDRAQANLFETLWIFAVAVLVAHVTGREDGLTLWGARLYVVARVIYVPLYASGVKLWRSVIYGIALVGLLLVLASLV